QNAYYRCELNQRLNRLHKLLKLFQAIWGQPLSGSALKGEAAHRSFHSWLLQPQASQPQHGQAFTSNSAAGEPCYGLWLMAMMGIWKGGCQVHLVSLGRTKAAGLLPERNFGTEAPGLVL